MPLDPRVRRLVGVMNRLDRRDDDAPMVDRRRASAATAARLGFVVMPEGPAPACADRPPRPGAGAASWSASTARPDRDRSPLYVFLHGGGWCVGTLAERDPRCRAISAGARCVVASVDYRMAPENAYPVPGEDCYAAARVAGRARRPSSTSTRLGSRSAASRPAATWPPRSPSWPATDPGPPICHQWLDVPATDLTLSQPSITSVPDGHLLDRSSIDRYLEHYLLDPAQATEAYASPLLADDLAGLPPAWIMSAEYDKLRDDGKAYADALAAAGVPVTYRLLEGHVHPSFAFTRLIPSARAYEAEAIAALDRAFRLRARGTWRRPSAAQGSSRTGAPWVMVPGSSTVA